MKVLSFGSLNFDHVYQLDHFVQPGETMAASSYQRGFGGKGLNQSIALAKAGMEVWHAGHGAGNHCSLHDSTKAWCSRCNSNNGGD